MSDDIDIDEHDVFDNPLIKRIFPDLTVIKKEVLYEYNEESSAVNNVIREDKIEDVCNLDKNVSPLLTFPTFCDEYADSKKIDSDIKTSSEYNTSECNNVINISPSKRNEIKVELKPDKLFRTKKGEDYNIINARVRLIDLGPYLDNCKKYCEICFILFPNEEELKVHKKSFHNFTVVNNNYEILQLNCDKTQQLKMSRSNKFKCNMCQKPFGSISGLYKHKRNIHFIRTKMFTRYSGNKNKTDTMNIPIRNNAKVSVNSSNHCFHCNAFFPNMQSLIEHLYDTLQTKKYENLNNGNKKETQFVNYNIKNQFFSVKSSAHQKHGTNKKVNNKHVSVSNSKLSLYKCPICSFYYSNVKYSLNHLLEKHKFNNCNGSLKKVGFDPKCKFCLSQFKSIQSYNTHIRKVHKKLLYQTVNTSIKSTKLSSNVNKTIEEKKKDIPSIKNLTLKEVHKESLSTVLSTSEGSQSILKSVLFKCNRCDVHFLHSQVATDHTSHLEILINWKCSLCCRIFKKNDELLHMQQHLVTENFTVHDICDTLPSVILYNCPKCFVHFEENIFLQHFAVCGTVTENKHIKCKLCGILIDDKLKFSHANHHKKNIVASKFYIIVHTEVVNTKISPDYKVRNMVIDNFVKPRTPPKQLDKKWLKVYYCNTCKCFINKGRKFLMHKKCNCIKIPPAYCTLCGLLISQTGVSTHRRIHERKNDLTLQDFKFYDMRNNRLIYPPIPEFPQCNGCGIHFGNLITKLRHECGMQNHITCTDCKKNYSPLGYKLHMYYHNYRLEEHNIKLKQISTVVPGEMQSITIADTKANKSSILESKNDETESFFYTCKNCDISVTTYDSMVEHCQEHYNPNKIQSLPKLCKDCDLMFEDACYQNHINIHNQNTKKNIEVIKFDIYFFMSKYGEWIKRVFDTIPEEQMQNIVKKSIYKYENKIKMQVIQEGHFDSTLYKCDQCQSFFVPCSLFKHIDSQCLTLPKHFCSICKIPFTTVTHKIKHEATHKQIKDFKSFRIVLFNRNEDKVLNESLRFQNWCTVFKCRNCNGVVNKSDYKDHLCNRRSLKKCSYCGLLLYPKEYDLHIHKHKEFGSFNSKKIKVILIGNKIENDEEKDLDNDKVSSFNGKIYDYIYYRCKKCQICIKDFRSTLKHNCSFKIPSSKCTLCGLCFEARKLKSHYLLHESDNNFLIDNITLTYFDHTESENTYNPPVQILETNNIIENREINNVSHDAGFLHKSVNQNEVKQKVITLYKCKCGLHFLDNGSLVTHRNTCNPKTRITRQECSKCGLTFSPNILFTHLLKHHGNKKKVFKFEVIDAFNE